VALTNLKKVELQYLDQWFSTLVDSTNYNIGQIQIAVPVLNMLLTNLDTAPIKYLRESLDKLVDNIDEAFQQFDLRLRKIEEEMKRGR
jgi:hypothetical protein